MPVGRVVIGGGTGFIGGHLAKSLADNGYKVTIISRSAGVNRVTWGDIKRLGLPEECTAVVSMSGANILNPMKRWNDDFKKEVWESRVGMTKSLAQIVSQAPTPPRVFVSFSGVGYYKPDPAKTYDESSPGGNFDYLSELCTAWEEASKVKHDVGKVRQVIVRCGVVLGRDGGLVKQIFWPYFFGMGGPIGSGKQWFPWVHVKDVAGFVTYAIRNEKMTGIFNLVAPTPATNEEFTKVFASTMNRPAVIPVPSIVMETVYGPERGKVVLEGQKVEPKRTLESGYKFLYPDLNSASTEVLQCCLKKD